MKKLVGKVTEEEKNEILALFERRNGLTELAKVITKNDEIYERLIADMGATSTKFQQWWDDMSQKYQWESSDNGSWEIDFNTCDIFLNF
ncbi:MAG: CXXX repeat peptide modification system protein [Alistipes sp.]|nr:CXXX repeat peptide modification system protein [Alistipes sp.]